MKNSQANYYRSWVIFNVEHVTSVALFIRKYNASRQEPLAVVFYLIKSFIKTYISIVKQLKAQVVVV